MQKDSKGIGPYAARDGLFAGAINDSGPDNDVRNPEPLPIFRDNFILLELRKKIRVSSSGILCHRARLIQYPSSGLVPVAIDRERTGADNSTK